MGSDGTDDPPFERNDLDMSNPLDRAILRGLHRARADRLAQRAHNGKLKQMGQEFEAKRKSGGRSRSRSRTR